MNATEAVKALPDIRLDEALNSWNTMANLARHLEADRVAGRDGAWQKQTAELLARSRWSEVAPHLQIIVDAFQEQLKRDAYICSISGEVVRRG